jgi:chromosome segregation protein
VTRLKELRLHGFKTFADPTRFVFERGVTAVIGPNGSGKSNMADAVRWVLGEQSNRSLRTRRADDVIFAGSQDRRPQGMAEAVLTLDNSDHWLPIEFTEVSIGRRAYRSGETEYLINGARARLKEVVELLAGGRLGANELVVVGQGTVDAALSLRPEERRQLFEEAAGVKNLQVRKNEALGRLARARDNLSRVGDLISELRPQVRRLALQAQHQEEHDALGRRARALVVEAHRRREVIARGLLGEARRRMAAAESAVVALRGEEEAGREAIATAESRYWAAEAAARGAADRREASREAQIRAEAGADAASRRHADLAEVIAGSEAELAAVAAALDATPDATDPDADDARWQAAREAERAWRTAVTKLAEAEREIGGTEEALAAARARAGAWLADAARRDETSVRAAARTERIERELLAARAAATEAAAALGPAQNELASAGAAEADAVARFETAQRAAIAAEQRADTDRARATALAERVGGLRAEMDALQERAEGGGRLGSTLAAHGWQAVLDAIEPPQAAWAAIETLIGGEIQQALVWRDGDLIAQAAGARGDARLLVEAGGADEAAEVEARAAALAAVGANRTLAEWIGSERGPRLFRRAAVAPDLGALLAGWHRLPAGWCAVTAEGDLADGRGLIVVRGRKEGPAGEAARQHARRRALAEMVGQGESEQREAAQSAAQALVAATTARREREEATQVHAEAERRAALARGAHGDAAATLARARELERALAAELDDARASAAADGSAPGPSPIAVDLEKLAAVASSAHQRHATLSGERDRRRAAWQLAQAAADATDAGTGSARYERAVLVARRDQLATTVQTQRETLTRLDSEAATASDAIAAAVAADAHAARDRAAADADRDRLRADLLERERARGGAASRLAELEREAQGAAIETQRLDDQLVAIGRERDLALESLPPTLSEPDAAAPDDATQAEMGVATLDVIDAELARVRRTLAQIGSVNPFAIEEHRELAGRLETLAGQDADLNAAIASTDQLIGRLGAEIATQFNAAFVAIGAKFDEFCRLLFAGGSASLQMSEAGDDEPAGGIEIAVRPPGKRPQRLAMLSGGERALAGVALLFAMLSVNPVPFCILDEVDAALDEANIGRFADALRQLAQQIDFVVITHNRATIETADTIYGVTMTDAAVSRLLSLRLADLPAEVLAG